MGKVFMKSVFLDANEMEFMDKVYKLEPVSGICAFVDFCNSTEIKRKGAKDWIVKFGYSMAKEINSVVNYHDHLIKIIGDELMLFIPTEYMEKTTFSIDKIVEQILDSVVEYDDADKLILHKKASIHYCEDVYPMTFKEGNIDVYGKSIDLTARLSKKAEKGKAIVSDVLFDKLSSELKRKYSYRDESDNFRGFNKLKTYFVFERKTR